MRDGDGNATYFQVSAQNTSITINEVTIYGHYVSPTTGQSGGYALSILSTKAATLRFRPFASNTWGTYELPANTQTQFYTFNKQSVAMNIYMLIKLH